MPADLLERVRARPPAALLAEWLPKLGIFGGVALELGCGAGAEAELLARSGFLVDAIDKNETAAKYARGRCAGLPVDVVAADVLDFDYRPDYYALAVALDFLPFMSKDRAAALIHEVQRALKPGGAVILSVYGPDHAWRMRADMNFWTKEEFASLWTGFTMHLLDERKGPWPLASGAEVFQHRLDLVAQKPAA